MVTGAERHRQQVPEGDTFIYVGSSGFAIFFLAGDTKLGAKVQLGRALLRCIKVDLGCILHVLGTCTVFAPLFIPSSLRAKPMDVHGSNFVDR